VLVVLVGGGVAYAMHHKKAAPTSSQTANNTQTSTTDANTVQSAPKPDKCSTNTLGQNVIVSISERHMWACAGSASQYDSPVVTGIAYLAADLTPTGTYHVYGKLTDQTLKGCDSTGCWNDPVSYWMPFLDNQYGTYGFHDATWRADKDFGNIDPNSANASHGCVELPLAAAKWLYEWAPVGTTVTIES